MRRVVLCLAVLGAAVLFVPRTGVAQDRAAIAGVVRDTSGAVMPGVLVEASSPALIEKTRSAVTDNAGQYKIVDLGPGTYEVSFTLAGFKVVRRGNIIIEGNFTPTVNAELQVGSLTEVLTVTAESPVVDVINNQQSFVASREVLDAIPTSRRDTTARALLIPGTTVAYNILGQYNMTSHGSSTSDFTMAIDGLRVNNLCGSGQFSGFYMNDAAVQELTYSTGSESAEIQSSGTRVNQVPKDGGNKFSGSFFLYGQKGCEATATNGCFMAADNRSDAAKAAGITIAGTSYDWQINPSFGGPLVKDKVWFYLTYRYQDNKIWVPSSHYADGSPAYRNAMGNYSGIGRVTWAATSKDKIRVYVEKQFNGEFYNGFNTYAVSTPEASSDAWGRGWIPQARWTRAQSNKLLFEAGIAEYNQDYAQLCKEGLPATALPVLNVSTGLLSGKCGYTLPPYSSSTKDFNVMASASYVTGSHAMKFGITDLWGDNSATFAPAANIDLLIKANIPGVNDFPANVVVYNTPATAIQRVNSDLGSYAQDTWTMKRVTLNYGARFEHFNASVPAESSPASTWIGARDFPAIPNVPNWNDWAVRFAVAYDLFGTGKTALKANVGKYVAAQAAGYAQTFNGMTQSTQTVTWTDLSRNGTIYDAAGNIETAEVGPRTANFGQITSRPDPALARGNNWEYSAVLQHELFPRVSVTAGYYRRDFYNLQVNDNQNLALSDWAAPFNVATPTDPRLPLSGQPIPIYNLNANKVGVATDTLVTYSTANKTTYNGVEFTANVRRDKFIAFGGVTTDRRASVTCDGSTTSVSSTSASSTARDTPNGARFCDSIPPFRTAVKASAAYSFPYDINLSGSFTSIPGPTVRADYTVNASVAGRPIVSTTAGANSLLVNLIEPGTVFLDYQNRMDLRVGKTFKLDRTKIQGFMDVFNVFNAGTALSVNQTYAASGTNHWGEPTTIIDGRYLRFGMQLNF